MSRRLLAIGGVLLVVLVACDPGSPEAAPFQGNWQSEAWGTYLSVSGGSVEIFEYSAAHCFSVASGGARGITDVLSLDGETLVLADAGRMIRFDRIEFLPERCIEPVADDPTSTFNVVVATMEEHHLPGVDGEWAARVEKLRPSAAVSDEALFAAINALLQPLDRPDVRLAAGAETWVAAETDPIQFPDALVSGRGGILTGSVGEEIAYLGFRRLGELADDFEGSQRAAADAIDSAVTSADSLVLDLRGSDGGSIDHAMLVASRIIPTEGVVAVLSAFGPDGLVSAGEVIVRPLPTRTFEGEVAVLVGPGTVGVAELLVVALSGVEGVTIVGEPTAGSPGPGMVRILPNGWAVGLANILVTTPTGEELLEGIVPDVLTDDPLEIALEILSD